jgi:hypothetical protein
MIGISDSTLTPDLKDYSDREYLTYINKGEAFFFSTGGDGTFPVTFELVEQNLPVINLEKGAKVISQTQIARIKFPSGLLKAADAGEMKDGNSSVELKVEPGNYKLRVFFTEGSGKDEIEFKVVLSKSDNQDVSNRWVEVDQLG